MRRTALTAAAGAVALLATPASAIMGFNYSACAPAGMEDPSLAIGSTAYVCLSFNGATTSVWQLKVDQFTALQVIGCEWARRLGVNGGCRPGLPRGEVGCASHLVDVGLTAAARSHLPARPFCVCAANYALPSGSGLLQQGYGWVPNATQETLNCSTLCECGPLQAAR
jgi:hypothetical protein